MFWQDSILIYDARVLGQDAPVAVVVLTALVVNLRYVMYSASLATYFGDPSTRWKVRDEPAYASERGDDAVSPQPADGLVWVVGLDASVGTSAIRLSFIALFVSFIALFGRLEAIPPGLERALRFVPAAVLTALVAPRLAYLDGLLALGPGNERLLAGAVAAVVAWRTESLLWTIVVGMVALWTLEWLPLGT